MKLKNQKGFTLIELMVVIVIIGILAAVAIPKMFGMSAKAKASEVAPSAAGWERIQAAYIIETSNVGNWTSLGFADPTSSSKTFSYSDNTTSNTSSVFNATPVADLNSTCTTADTWTSTMSNTLGSDATRATPAGCEALTPSFN